MALRAVTVNKNDASESGFLFSTMAPGYVFYRLVVP